MGLNDAVKAILDYQAQITALENKNAVLEAKLALEDTLLTDAWVLSERINIARFQGKVCDADDTVRLTELLWTAIDVPTPHWSSNA